MTNEMVIWCEKYNFNDDMKLHIENIEKTYKLVMELEKDKIGDDQLAMSEWIYKNTRKEELKGFSDRDKFLYGLGILSTEILVYKQKAVKDYLTVGHL